VRVALRSSGRLVVGDEHAKVPARKGAVKFYRPAASPRSGVGALERGLLCDKRLPSSVDVPCLTREVCCNRCLNRHSRNGGKVSRGGKASDAEEVDASRRCVAPDVVAIVICHAAVCRQVNSRRKRDRGAARCTTGCYTRTSAIIDTVRRSRVRPRTAIIFYNWISHLISKFS